jgi:hypothetical protein
MHIVRQALMRLLERLRTATTTARKLGLIQAGCYRREFRRTEGALRKFLLAVIAH